MCHMNSKPKTEIWQVDPRFNNSEQTWEALCDHLKRKRIFTLAFYNSCISTPILKTKNDNLCDSQLLIGWDNSQGDPMTKTVCEVESAHLSHMPSMPWYTRFCSKTLCFCDVQLYGFPRLYRRMAELNRYINKNNPKRRESVENGLQRLFRLPTHIYQTLQRWRGVPDPPQGPPSATGHVNSGASPAQHPSQHTQVRHHNHR